MACDLNTCVVPSNPAASDVPGTSRDAAAEMMNGSTLLMDIRQHRGLQLRSAIKFQPSIYGPLLEAVRATAHASAAAIRPSLPKRHPSPQARLRQSIKSRFGPWRIGTE